MSRNKIIQHKVKRTKEYKKNMEEKKLSPFAFILFSTKLVE